MVLLTRINLITRLLVEKSYLRLKNIEFIRIREKFPNLSAKSLQTGSYQHATTAFTMK
jgi:hypothetical protein